MQEDPLMPLALVSFTEEEQVRLLFMICHYQGEKSQDQKPFLAYQQDQCVSLLGFFFFWQMCCMCMKQS